MKYFKIEFWNYQRHGMLDYQVYEAKTLRGALHQWKRDWMKYPSQISGEYSKLINVYEVTSKKLVIPRDLLREKSIKRVNR